MAQIHYTVPYSTMAKLSKHLRKHHVAYTAYGALLISGIGAWISYSSDIFNQEISEHDAIAASFLNQIDSATGRGASDEADRVRVDFEKFEETWRKGRSIFETVASLLFGSPFDIAPEARDSVGTWLANVETHPEWGLTYDAENIGHAWFVAGDYERAADEYQAALAENSDNIELQLSQLRALYYAGMSADDEQRREQLNNEATQVYRLIFMADYPESLPPYIASDANFVNFMGALAKETSPEG